MDDRYKDIDKMKEGYSKFSDYIKNSLNCTLLLQCFDKSTANDIWPDNYNYFKDFQLPEVTGDEIAEFLIWYIFNYGFDDLNQINFSEDDKKLLHFIGSQYFRKMYMGLFYCDNPLGYFETDCIEPSYSNKITICIKRNDGQSLNLNVTPVEILKLLSDFSDSLDSYIGSIETILADDEEFFSSQIVKIKEFIERFESIFIKEECQNEEK